MPIYNTKRFRESSLAHRYLDGLKGLEIGGSYHNAFGLDTLNVDFTPEMNTEFKREEIALCGAAMPVDIVAHGSKIPVPAKSYDFVLSSHVIEHFFDPLGALEEWRRIARRYIFIICPQPTALEADRSKSITSLRELKLRHSGHVAPPVEDDHQHYTRWTSGTFVQMCRYCGFNVVDVHDPDDKVGNGFTIVIDVAPSMIVGAKCWWTRQMMKVRQRAFELIAPQPPLDVGGE
jgi:SAM-dependent methyltransferase